MPDPCRTPSNITNLEKITHRAKNSRLGCSDYLFTSRYYEVHLSKPELALPLIISQTDSENRRRWLKKSKTT